METRITIKMDNAAFEDDPSVEVARILNDLAARIHFSGVYDQSLRDINGNEVGWVSVVEDIDLNDPPAWALGQDPYRCEGCGSFLIDNGAEEPTCWECDA